MSILSPLNSLKDFSPSKKYSDLELVGVSRSASTYTSVDKTLTLGRPDYSPLVLSTREYGIDEPRFLFRIPESGFYVLGFYMNFVATEINDFSFSVSIWVTRNQVQEKVLERDIRTLFSNERENASFETEINLVEDDVLEAKIKYSKGNLRLDYFNVYAFKTDKELDLNKNRLIHYHRLNNANYTQDYVGTSTLSLKTSPPNFNATGTIINGLKTLALDNIDLANEAQFPDGFSINIWIKALVADNLNPDTYYFYLLSKTKPYVSTATNIDIVYTLYYDIRLSKFVLEYLDETNTPRRLESRIVPSLAIPTMVSLVYDSRYESLKLYVNGILQDSNSFPYAKILNNPSDSTSNFITIGAKSALVMEELHNGIYTLSDLSIFDSGISVKEIKNVYNLTDTINKNAPAVIQDLYNNGSGSSSGISLPIGSDNVNHVRTDTTVATVETELRSLQSQISMISSSNVNTYQGSIVLTDWVLDVGRGAYYKSIPFSIHGIMNPWEVQVQVAYNTTYVFSEACCGIEMDNMTKDIYLYVNDVPFGGFAGRFIIIGY